MLSKEELEAYSREYYSMVFRFCMSRLSNKADAEDAVQNTFAAFSEKAHLIKPEFVKPWLLRTAHHSVLKEYRRLYKEKDFVPIINEETLELSKKVRTFEEDMVDCYIEKYLEEIYEKLNEREKALFDLYSDGNIKTGQIANLIGIEPHACSMRKKRLKEKCREIMQEILFY